MPQRTDNERLAIIEKVASDHEGDIKELNIAIKGLANEIHMAGNGLQAEIAQTRLRMEKSISFIGGVAFSFGTIGGLLGAGMTLLMQHFGKD